MPAQDRRARSRERIVTAAAAAFRARGYAATGVDAVMAEAGLTHGGFYAHFPSKADLLAAAVAHACGNPLITRVAGLAGAELLAVGIDAYLSMAHRDHPESGCPIPTLGAELPRLDPALGATLGGPVQHLAERFAAALPPPEATRAARAQALLALLVGGIITARTLPADAAEAWLANCRRIARGLAGLPTDAP